MTPSNNDTDSGTDAPTTSTEPAETTEIGPPEGDSPDSNPGGESGKPPSPAGARAIFAARLEAAGLDTHRFIRVQEGEKEPINHDQYPPDSPALRGNYGVYGGPGAGDDTGWILVDIDVDDYDGDHAPDWIPETFTVATPHTDGCSSGHSYVTVPSGAIDALEAVFGTANPNPPWGEIRIHNQYCVGPGSQLDGCGKDWCDDCAHDDGGYYRIAHDAPIARMETDEFVAAVRAEMPDREHERRRAPPDLADGVTLDDYEPTATTAEETTGNVRDVFAALDRLDARDVAERTIVHAWNDAASTSEGYRAFAPTWGPDCNGTANIVDDRIWQDTGGSGYGGPIAMALIDTGDLRPETASPRVHGKLWWTGVEHLRDLGFDIPEYDPAEADAAGDGHPRIVECAPPEDDLKPVDVDDLREEIHGPFYDEFTDHDDGPTVGAYLPGTGKTTTADRAADDRDRAVAFLFDKHRKAHEHRADDLTPDADLHLRGAAQPRDDSCARALYEAETCDEHGDPQNCPRMCPLYDLDPGASERRIFEALAAEVGPVAAHIILEPHDGEACVWMDVFDEIEDADRVVGVHEYQRLKTLRSGPSDGERDTIVDETPGELADDRRLTVAELVRMANTLEKWTARNATGETLRRFGRFARDLADAVTNGEDLAALDAPVPVWDSYQTYNTAAGNYTEYVEAADGKDWQLTEALARARRAFLDHLLADISDDDREWDRTPLAFDALLAAAVGAGLDETAARTAAGGPLDLEHCPICKTGLNYTEGRRVCEGCGWDERDRVYSTAEDTPARILAWIDADPDDPDAAPALVRRELPAPEDLPDAPLILDATATPEKIAAFYGADEADVQVHGAEQHALDNLHVTQIHDGQYHYNTLANAVDEGHASADWMQAILDHVGELHDRPLVVGRRGVPDLFDLPTNAEFIHFHGARGLNFEQCDAVVIVGGPHPHIPDIKRTARLLAQDRDDFRVGGVEHSTRKDCPNPPFYRTLRYTDDDGRGRAVPTKHYTGLVGALFREAREKEIEQMVHRTRPVLADDDETIPAYLLTNVPTDLPVDEVCSLEELAETPAAMLPVVEGALTLAETLGDVAAGDGPDGFRAGSLVERDGNGGVRFRIREVHRLARGTGQDVCTKTVRRWIDDLEDIGLVDSGDYLHREGVPYSADGATLTRALSVLTSNVGVEVAKKRRLAALAQEADSAAAWLRAARALVASGEASEHPTPAADGWPPPD